MRPIALLAVALLTGCFGALQSTVIVAPDEFPGYPNHAENGVILLEATYYTNQREIFDTDLSRLGYLPVALRIGSRGRDQVVRRLNPSSSDLRLYLQDGTPLTWIPAEDVVHTSGVVRDRIAKRALTFTVLPEWHEAEPGFVFFRLDDERIDGTNALSKVGSFYRELDLLQSVISVTVTTDEGPRELFCGLRSGHLTK